MVKADISGAVYRIRCFDLLNDVLSFLLLSERD
jgi:hypothetical protein